ncbi:MAG TPA: hypothetical protein VM187_08375, partial [Niastella sp.]|nr:hypothetical protein [Niastella sp.]
ITADGQSSLLLSVTKSVTAKPGVKVVFSTNKGTLLNDNVVFTGNTAVTSLKVSQDTGIYVIKAVVKNEKDSMLYQNTITFNIKRALPDHIFLEANRTISTMSGDTPTIIKTFLTRDIGLVTTGTAVNFRSYQLKNPTNDTVVVGRFEGLFNNYSKPDGTLNNISFFSDTRNIDSSRVVTIEATAAGRTGIILTRINLRYK